MHLADRQEKLIYQQQDKGETIMDITEQKWFKALALHLPEEVFEQVSKEAKEYEKQQSYTEPAITILDNTNPAPVEVIPTKF